MPESSIYRPEVHGRVPLKAKWKAECRNCGWMLDAGNVSVGETPPPPEIACPRCLMDGKWNMLRVVRY